MSLFRWLGVATCWLVPQLLTAQAVSPPIAEYAEKASSSFQLQNSTLFPLTVVLEVRGFKVTEEGEVVDVPLDTSRVRVKLSEMSFQIPPRGSHRVFYEATSQSVPAWFNILSAMTGARTESGLNVRLLLPHVVYLNQKQSLKRQQVTVRAFEFDPAAGKSRIQLENLGPNLGRVLQVSITDGTSPNQMGGGFPLFPRSRRWTEVPWEGRNPPTRLMLRFARFSIDTLLTATPASLAADTTAKASHP